ncbi:protein FAM166C [Phodopus roborovskii]|uniref:Ciliary microtubule inner protein 2C n=1 Tax=Phodopus roborovskii TaxID=109678 RepID=A0AAU9Z486_PHORO|nr:protein FAM166C [Phodopus roborovskii]CAH6786893.1 Fam166c [Phodopus roborovskii]
MASRSAGTLMTEFNATFVPPALMPGYKGHVPGVASSFGSPYGTTTFKYFQDLRNTALEKSYAVLSGGCFPTLFSPNPSMVLTSQAKHWDRWLHMPTYTRFNLDIRRNSEITNFYQTAQQQRKYYQDKTGTVPRVPYFVLPVKELDRYPLPTDLPPLSPKNKWHLLRVSPDYLKTYQTFPSGKRVSSQERQRRDNYFEFRA